MFSKIQTFLFLSSESLRTCSKLVEMVCDFTVSHALLMLATGKHDCTYSVIPNAAFLMSVFITHLKLYSMAVTTCKSFCKPRISCETSVYTEEL